MFPFSGGDAVLLVLIAAGFWITAEDQMLSPICLMRHLKDKPTKESEETRIREQSKIDKSFISGLFLLFCLVCLCFVGYLLLALYHLAMYHFFHSHH